MPALFCPSNSPSGLSCLGEKKRGVGAIWRPAPGEKHLTLGLALKRGWDLGPHPDSPCAPPRSVQAGVRLHAPWGGPARSFHSPIRAWEVRSADPALRFLLRTPRQAVAACASPGPASPSCRGGRVPAGWGDPCDLSLAPRSALQRSPPSSHPGVAAGPGQSQPTPEVLQAEGRGRRGSRWERDAAVGGRAREAGWPSWAAHLHGAREACPPPPPGVRLLPGKISCWKRHFCSHPSLGPKSQS